MGLAKMYALTELGLIDPTSIELTDFSRPDGFLERQVSRWNSELESYPLLRGPPVEASETGRRPDQDRCP
ncbi:hypothetical protein [Rhodococcus chondri]|uniref:Uncharacterized protein n=1 Tax=Rhodococcus chondri TaxID=3065941 RepID=A0ABU7JRK4_9NOCA|nr:hypothetical protein [Rhodococcus sp. CC-R104]MEE2032653.1 hypothetical protein [Rhodococcus sp. CC-R104]